MYHNKLSASQKEQLLKQLRLLKSEIEYNNNPLNQHPESVDEIKKWRIFTAFPIPTQQKIWDQWEEYYREVQLSPIYALFQEQRIALRKGDMVRVQDLAQQAREMRKNNDLQTVKKPTSVDPWEFQRGWVKALHDCEKKIKDIEHEIDAPNEEAEKVWKQ